MTRSFRLFGFAAVFALAGCMSVPLSSLVELSRIDFATTDLDVMRVAVRLPGAIRPRAGGVKMEAVRKIGDGEEETTTFLLVPATEPVDRAGPPNDGREGFATYVYRLAPADMKRFEALRADLMANKTAGKRVSLGLGIATTEFCRIRRVPDGPLPTTTYLLTSETARYIVLTNDYDLRKDEAVAKELPKLGAC